MGAALTGLEMAEPPGELLWPRLAAVVHAVRDGFVHNVHGEGAEGRVGFCHAVVMCNGKHTVEDVVLLLRPQLLCQLPSCFAKVSCLDHVVDHVFIGLATYSPPPALGFKAALQDHLSVPLHLPLMAWEAAQAGLERRRFLIGALPLNREEKHKLLGEKAVDIFNMIRIPQAGKDSEAAHVIVEAILGGQRAAHRQRLPSVALGHAFVDGAGNEEVDRLTFFDHGDLGAEGAGHAVGTVGSRVALLSEQTLGGRRRLSIRVQLVEIAKAVLRAPTRVQGHKQSIQQQNLVVCVLQEVGVLVYVA